MFTVKQLAKLAGVTPRALRHYDAIGLFKPSRIGANGYRYYDEAALLRLQQILFYRTLGMPLERIRGIMDSLDFDPCQALESHQANLRQQIVYLERLLITVERTLDHLKGIQTMSPDQLFDVFNEAQQAEYEKEAMRLYDPAIVKASNQKWKNYSTVEKQRIGEEGNAIYQDMLLTMPKGAASAEAQACVERWRCHLEYFWIPDDDQLLGLANGYNDDPRFKANY